MGRDSAALTAVDRTSKLAFARIYRRATALISAAFLKVLAKAVPYRIHTVLRQVVAVLVEAHGRSVVRACRIAGLSRAAY